MHAETSLHRCSDAGLIFIVCCVEYTCLLEYVAEQKMEALPPRTLSHSCCRKAGHCDWNGMPWCWQTRAADQSIDDLSRECAVEGFVVSHEGVTGQSVRVNRRVHRQHGRLQEGRRDPKLRFAGRGGRGRAGQGRQVKAGSPPVSAVCASSLPHALIGLFINHALCTL